MDETLNGLDPEGMCHFRNGNKGVGFIIVYIIQGVSELLDIVNPVKEAMMGL